MAENNKIHIPTVLISLLVAGCVGLGAYMVTINVTADTVKKHGDKIEVVDTELKDHGERIIKLETAFTYVKQNVAEIKVVQQTILDEVRQINGTH